MWLTKGSLSLPSVWNLGRCPHPILVSCSEKTRVSYSSDLLWFSLASCWWCISDFLKDLWLHDFTDLLLYMLSSVKYGLLPILSRTYVFQPRTLISIKLVLIKMEEWSIPSEVSKKVNERIRTQAFMTGHWRVGNLNPGLRRWPWKAKWLGGGTSCIPYWTATTWLPSPDGSSSPTCWPLWSPDVVDCTLNFGSSNVIASLKDCFGDSLRKTKNYLVIRIHSSTPHREENPCKLFESGSSKILVIEMKVPR